MAQWIKVLLAAKSGHLNSILRKHLMKGQSQLSKYDTESFLCWSATTKTGAHPEMWLLYPVKRHWRKLVFPLQASILKDDVKKILHYDSTEICGSYWQLYIFSKVKINSENCVFCCVAMCVRVYFLPFIYIYIYPSYIYIYIFVIFVDFFILLLFWGNFLFCQSFSYKLWFLI